MAEPSTLARSRSRALSLRAPIANEEERALFQHRLALTHLVVSALALGFWLVQLAVLAALHPEHVPHMFLHRSVQVQIATGCLPLVAWAALRRGKRSTRFLDAADVVTTLGTCLGWAVMAGEQPDVRSRIELVSLLASSYTLALRAALVPSTPARSAALALVAIAPLAPVTFRLHASGPPGHDPVAPAIYVMIWALVATACVTVISWVVYGLRLEVRKAMQLGQYVLEDKIGEGGMGVVYRAHHAMLRRATAVKLLVGTTAPATLRFEREVRITARLTHPNTIAVYDYGRTPDGVFYYAMEYLEGISLETLVEEHGPQPPARVVHLLVQICGALEEAHAEGLVHRDIKPANVMLTERGGVRDVVKVLDFGLVKEIANQDASLSTVNALLGTPHYMSPEAILAPTSIDERADLYAVGATAFYLLTGERVFDGSTLVEVCSQHLHQPADAPSARRAGIPEPLDRIVLACLDKAPERRPANAATLAAMLGAAGVPAWSRADADAWWGARGARTGTARANDATAAATATATSGLGKAMAIALEDRA